MVDVDAAKRIKSKKRKIINEIYQLERNKAEIKMRSLIFGSSYIYI